jgi:DNA adenine methylase
MEPFLKWAGGKRWLISKSDQLFPAAGSYKRYFEPFLGSGAVFFHLKPSSGILSDINEDLINAYNAIKNNWKDLFDILSIYDKKHSVEFYYRIRSAQPKTPLLRASRFIYLNRTCWNGLYRVNKRGEFNVPKGTKEKVVLENDDFEMLSKILKRVNIKHWDFEKTIDAATEDDFVFVDPPYTVKHNLNGFLKYNENIFSWDDQIRLRNSIVRAKKRGVSFLILNANHNSIQELYKNVGEILVLNRASVIAAKASARGTYSELAIKC